MPRQRNPNREKAYKLWLERNGEISNRQIAELLGENEKVIAVWKQRDKWNVVQQSDESCTTKKRGAPAGNKNAVGNNGGAPVGNRNAVGNSGGSGGPAGNSKAATHGFFRRIFPDDEETHAIVNEIGIKSPIDILWENIVIQYTAIARAQKIMFVQDREDETRVLKRQKESEMSSETEWEYQHAWDKHATFLQAQSRAISTLEGLISRFEDMLMAEIKTEEKRLKLEKLKVDIAKVKGEEGPTEDDGFMEALKAKAREVWSSDDNESGGKT